MRLVIILLLLVVLPTALLSVLAGRSIQAREVILQNRLEQDGLRLIESVRSGLQSQFKTDAARVSDAFRATFLAGVSVERGSELLLPLLTECVAVKSPYLFMNPWGFVFPKVPGATADNAMVGDVLLRQRLIDRLTGVDHRQRGKITLHIEDRTYCFYPMLDFSGIYSGFEVDVAAAMEHVESLVSSFSTEDIVLKVARGEAGASGGDNGGDISISDSFSTRSHKLEGRAAFGDSPGILASKALGAPFLRIQIEARHARPYDVMSAVGHESRLIGWGIFLLAIVIIGGSSALIYRTLNQASVARRRSEFVIGMSHDLRTPVASMRIMADSLSAGRIEDPEKQQYFLRTISSECERLGDMIERVLFFFRQEHRAMTYTMTSVDVGEVVAYSVNAFRERQQGRVSVGLDVGDAPAMVLCDSEALAKVLTNLLDNAVKYGLRSQELAEAMQGDDISVCIRSQRWRGRLWWVVSVSDYGSGIPASEQRKIFNRFYRRDTEVHRHVGGIGLGLSLCSDIIRAHRGRIVVESQVGEGAAFSVWLISKGES
jgi:signal transduction histidine kinase